MLVPAMNRHEVLSEIKRDQKKLVETSYPRLVKEYEKERKKLKINKTEAWGKVYQIRTAAKNNWLVFIAKCPAAPVYNNEFDLVCGCFVYQHTNKGMQVMRQMQNGTGVEVFNGHVFARFNQRLHLNLTNPLDIVKRFFLHNGYNTTDLQEKNGKLFSTAMCKEGLLLGNYYKDPFWLIHKTFISKELERKDQLKKEREMLLDMQIEMASKSTQFLRHLDGKKIFLNDQVYHQLIGQVPSLTVPQLPFEIPQTNNTTGYPVLFR
jgi:hypothetical protein